MYKLLIVDDETKIRNGLCNFFPWHELGFEVAASAVNGKQALDYILAHQVDVVLSDINMPVMSGVELAEQLHCRKSKAKLIFLTGFKEFEYAQKAVIYGVKNYIVKPTKMEELAAVFAGIKEELDLEQEVYPRQTDIVEAGTVFKDEAIASQGYHGKKIAAIKAYVLEHYREVTLEEVSKQFHMNVHYLSKYFKKWSGQNFSEYLISVKMEKAAELLKGLTYKTYEISSAVGYDNAKNFSRAFKDYFGKSPREYRDASH